MSDTVAIPVHPKEVTDAETGELLYDPASAEYALFSYLGAWARRDWESLAVWASRTWMGGVPSAAKILRSIHLYPLRAANLTEMTYTGDSLFTAKALLTLVIARDTVKVFKFSVQIVREPDADGAARWGVVPSSFMVE